MSTLELIKLIVSSGELGLLAVVLFGLFKLADRYIPLVLASHNGHTAAIVALSAEVRALTAANDARDAARMSDIADSVAEIRGAAYVTGQHQAITLEREPPSRSPSDPTRRR